jgi:hypothetical protein
MENQISDKLYGIIEKHLRQIEVEIDDTLKNELESCHAEHERDNSLASIRNRSEKSLKINGDDEELQYTLAVEFLVFDDRQIDRAIENAIFQNDDLN